MVLRCEKIYVGILKNATIYKTQDPIAYTEIVHELDELSYLLRMTGLNKYFLLYVLIKVFGISQIKV